MKTLFGLIFALLFSLSIFAGEERTGISLDSKSGAIAVWVCSSEPPATDSRATEKPTWKNGESVLPGIHNMWYSLESRTGSVLRIGGFGDDYTAFLRFPVTLAGRKTILRIFCSAKGKGFPDEVEIRQVTTAEPLPIRPEKVGDSWTPERIIYAAQPSSKPFVSFRPVEGWNEIDITVLANLWVKSPEKNHGLKLVSTEHRDNWCEVLGPADKEHPPELVTVDPTKPVAPKKAAEF